MIETIIFDWKRTLYDPDTQSLMTGAIDLLSYLQKKKLSLVLIGKGGEEMYQEVDRLKVKEYFSQVVFKEGVKDPSLYQEFMTTDPQETVFIGDRVRSELSVGNKLKAVTIWLKLGKFAEEGPENESQKPTYTVTTLSEVKNLLATLL